jgi:hypothetical protein
LSQISRANAVTGIFRLIFSSECCLIRKVSFLAFPKEKKRRSK